MVFFFFPSETCSHQRLETTRSDIVPCWNCCSSVLGQGGKVIGASFCVVCIVKSVEWWFYTDRVLIHLQEVSALLFILLYGCRAVSFYSVMRPCDFFFFFFFECNVIQCWACMSNNLTFPRGCFCLYTCYMSVRKTASKQRLNACFLNEV